MKKLKTVGVAKQFTFEAAHQLPHYAGKCANLHGHTYRLLVIVHTSVANIDKSGIAIDFGVLKDIVNAYVVDVYDHKNLNDFFETPSAEVMVMRIGEILEEALTRDPRTRNCQLTYVRLYETDTCFAEWTT